MEQYSVYSRIFKYARSQKNISQESLAVALRTTRPSIGRIESGHLVPSETLLRRLERYVGIGLLEMVEKSV